MNRRSVGMICLAAAVFAGGLAPEVAQAVEPVPVLWEGIVVDSDGEPAQAEVVAYARPAAADLEVGNALTEVARTRTDRHGAYSLRAAHAGAMRAVEDEAGWANVMVVAFGEDGTVSMALDSVAWLPDNPAAALRAVSSDGDRGRWVTTPVERIRAQSHHDKMLATGVDGPSSAEIATERPAALVLGDAPGRPLVTAQGASVGPRVPNCYGPQSSKKMGVHPVDVGEIHVNRDWKGIFEYRQASSTSFQVGSKWEGKGWSVAGSTSSVKGEARGAGNKVLTGPNLYTYAAEMIFEQYAWKCEVGREYKWIYTLEPETWTTGLPRRDGGPAPKCNPRFKSTVSPNGFLYREDGSSTTHEAGISVHGFTGSTTTASSAGVYQFWENQRNEQRYLCGSTAFVHKNTRVHSPA
jgi:hypothetical protein